MSKAITIPSKRDFESLFVLPDPESVTDINKVSKSGPQYVSLKEHEEYNGMAILVTQAEIIPGTIPDKDTGAINDYLRCVAAIYPSTREPSREDIVILQTGAGDVFRRVVDAMEAHSLPIRGILHKHGRAWSIG